MAGPGAPPPADEGVYGLALELIGLFEAAGTPYALGGALALGYHAPPRGTRDVDLNLFVEPAAAKPVFDLLAAHGYEIDPARAVARAADRGDAIAWKNGTRIDLFVNSIPLHDQAFRRRIRVDFAGRRTWILSPEDLVVLKLLFDRAKDHVDVEQVLFTQAETFDGPYARGQLVDHVGETDGRVAAFDRLAGRFLAGRPGRPS